MTLLWKLLRCHLSIAQTVGFALAGLVGMTIVLAALQAYRDVLPVFNAPDSFMQGDYLVLSKRVGALQTLGLGSSDFTSAELDELKTQPFVRDAGAFTPADYRVKGTVGSNFKYQFLVVSLLLYTEVFYSILNITYRRID